MIIAILLLAFVLRVINLDQSLWLDEATQAILSSNSLYSIWNARAVDFHPPLSYILFHFWLNFGKSEIWLRLLPAIFGVATVFVTYLLSNKLFNKKIGLIAAFLLAIAPYHIYYSQEVRMYSFATFFAITAVYFFTRPFKNKTYNHLGFIIASALLIYTHYLGFFLLAALVIYAIKTKTTIWKNLGFIGLLWLPWYPQFLKQLNSGVNAEQYLPGWSNVLSLDPFKALPLTFIKFSLGRIDFYDNFLYGAIAIFIFLVFGWCLYSAIKVSKNLLIWIWLLVPIIFAFLISFKLPLNQPFRLLFVLPAFYILIAVGIYNIKTFRKIFLGLVIFISIFGLMNYYLNDRFWREDWRDAVSFTNSRTSETNAKVVFAWSESFSPFIWYGGNHGMGVAKSFPVTESEINKELNLEGINEIYLFEYLSELSDPQKNLPNFLNKSGYRLRSSYNFNGVGLVHQYSK